MLWYRRAVKLEAAVRASMVKAGLQDSKMVIQSLWYESTQAGDVVKGRRTDRGTDGTCKAKLFLCVFIFACFSAQRARYRMRGRVQTAMQSAAVASHDWRSLALCSSKQESSRA